MLILPVLAAFVICAVYYAVWRVCSRKDLTIPRVRLRLDDVAMIVTVMALLLLTVIALWP